MPSPPDPVIRLIINAITSHPHPLHPHPPPRSEAEMYPVIYPAYRLALSYPDFFPSFPLGTHFPHPPLGLPVPSNHGISVCKPKALNAVVFRTWRGVSGRIRPAVNFPSNTVRPFGDPQEVRFQPRRCLQAAAPLRGVAVGGFLPTEGAPPPPLSPPLPNVGGGVPSQWCVWTAGGPWVFLRTDGTPCSLPLPPPNLLGPGRPVVLPLALTRPSSTIRSMNRDGNML